MKPGTEKVCSLSFTKVWYKMRSHQRRTQQEGLNGLPSPPPARGPQRSAPHRSAGTRPSLCRPATRAARWHGCPGRQPPRPQPNEVFPNSNTCFLPHRKGRLFVKSVQQKLDFFQGSICNYNFNYNPHAAPASKLLHTSVRSLLYLNCWGCVFFICWWFFVGCFLGFVCSVGIFGGGFFFF